MPPAIERMARSFLRCPAIINVGDPGQAKKDIEQNLEFLAEAKKKKRLEEMLVGAEPPIIAACMKKGAVMSSRLGLCEPEEGRGRAFQAKS